MTVVSFKDILSTKNNLAPSQLEVLAFPNHNFKFVKDFLTRKLVKSDNGHEVGSTNYISQSPKKFFKAKALTSTSYLPDFTPGSTEFIRPQVFVDYGLKKDDILISKDSNIGEVIILDKDYPDHMPSGAIYRLPVEENKYYLLAFMKSSVVKDQLDTMVPKGATIRHAKTLFLDCKVPLPNQTNADEVIAYVENMMRLIIDKEKAIQEKKLAINNLIDHELGMDDDSDFTYKSTILSDLLHEKRLDTGLYGKEYQKVYNKIINYRHGHKTLKRLGYDIVRGQNLQISNIGRSIYTDVPTPDFYKLILSKDFTEWMTYTRNSYIGNPKALRTIKQGDVIFSCRGDLGRVVVFCENQDGYITNIDNVHIRNKSASNTDNIFIGSFLLHLRSLDWLSKIAITGSGADSFTKYQFSYIKIPNFPDGIKLKIANLFYHSLPLPAFDASNVVGTHREWNDTVGIYDLDKAVKAIQSRLDEVIDNITNNIPVDIVYDF